MLEMQSSDRKKSLWITGLWSLGLSLAVVFLDQLSKHWIRANLQIGQSLFDIGFFRVDRIENTGAAFGLFPGQTGLLTILSLAGVVVLVVFTFRYHSLTFIKGAMGRLALGLILGGTAGNLVDRFTRGYVTDFVDFKLWPAFNVADFSISIGVIILAFIILRMAKRTEE